MVYPKWVARFCFDVQKIISFKNTMTEKPFAYKKAFTNVYSNYMFHEQLVKILPKLINCNGIINVGGKAQSSYNFAKKFNKKTIKIKNTNNKFPSKQTMNLSKLRNILKQNN